MGLGFSWFWGDLLGVLLALGMPPIEGWYVVGSGGLWGMCGAAAGSGALV